MTLTMLRSVMPAQIPLYNLQSNSQTLVHMKSQESPVLALCLLAVTAVVYQGLMCRLHVTDCVLPMCVQAGVVWFMHNSKAVQAIVVSQTSGCADLVCTESLNLHVAGLGQCSKPVQSAIIKALCMIFAKVTGELESLHRYRAGPVQPDCTAADELCIQLYLSIPCKHGCIGFTRCYRCTVVIGYNRSCTI